MKVLFMYCKKFGYNPTTRTLDFVPEAKEPKEFSDIQVAFIQAEKEDEERMADVEKKLVKNIKWVCGKNGVKKVVLHSFAHLSESKADPEFTLKLFENVEKRLKSVDYEVYQTPFGHFLDLKLDAPGNSLARVFKDI